jgi:hypothetical protein
VAQWKFQLAQKAKMSLSVDNEAFCFCDLFRRDFCGELD